MGARRPPLFLPVRDVNMHDRLEAAAKRQRRWRERQKAKLGQDKYNQGNASYQRDLRERHSDAKRSYERHKRRDPQQEPDPKTERKLEHKPEPKPEPKPELKPELKPERKSERRPVVRAATPPPLERGTVEPARLKGCGDLEQQIRARRDEVVKHDPEARAPTDRTISKQFDRVKVLYRKMFGRQFACRDFEWTRDTKRVLKFIAEHKLWTTEASRNCHRAALAAILRNLEGYEEVAHLYGHESTLGNRIIDQQVGENSLRGTARANYMTWEELARRVMRVPPGTADSALTAIYTFAPPRRLLDYCVMRLAVDRDLKTLDDSANYLGLDSQMNPGDFCFNVYKTSRSLGQQIIAVHPHVVPLLKAYILRERLGDGDLLFPDFRGRPHGNFSRIVSSTFERTTGKPVSVDLLRHAYITMALDKRPTLNERKQLAWEMAHSVATQAEYEILDPALEPNQRRQDQKRGLHGER